jgi:hypothetical protein
MWTFMVNFGIENYNFGIDHVNIRGHLKILNFEFQIMWSQNKYFGILNSFKSTNS